MLMFMVEMSFYACVVAAFVCFWGLLASVFIVPFLSPKTKASIRRWIKKHRS